MSLLRTLGIVVVAGLLTMTLASTNAVVAGHRTVLDPGFVTDTLEEEGAYTEFNNATQQALTERADLNGSTGGSLAAGVVDEAVTEAYVRNQVNSNIRRGYAYLHGNSMTLNLTVRTQPVVDNATDAVERRIRNASTERLLNRTDEEIAFDQGPINKSMITRMDDGPEEYRAVKAELRANVRERVIDEGVDQAYNESLTNETRTDQVLVGLRVNNETENPHDEKTRIVRNNSDAVNVTIRDEVNESDELDRRVDENYQKVLENETRTDAMLVELGRRNDTQRPHDEKKQIIRNNSAEVNETLRNEIRPVLVEEGYERAVTNETATDQVLVALRVNDDTENPHGEKKRVIRNNSDAVNTTLRTAIVTNRSDEVNRTIDEELRAGNNESANETIGDAKTVSESVSELQAVYREGLTTNTTYEEFESNRTLAKETLATNSADRAETKLNESVPNEISLSEISNPTLRQQFERAKGIVGLVDLAAIALPVVAAVLVGLVYALTRSAGQVLSTTGTSFFFAGLPTFVFTAWARGTIASYIPDDAGFAGELMTGLFDRVLGTLAGQSLAIAVVGVILWAAGFAIRKEYVDLDELVN